MMSDSPVSATKFKLTYSQLLKEVQACAIMLSDLGVRMGDRILIYMPMVPEAIVSMLACARIGAIHTVVFGGFGAPELAVRIDNADTQRIAWHHILLAESPLRVVAAW